MEKMESYVDNEFYKMGMEYFYEDYEPERFKAQNPEEQRCFLEGYKAALEETLELEEKEENSLNISH